MKSLLCRFGAIITAGFLFIAYAQVWGADWKFYGLSLTEVKSEMDKYTGPPMIECYYDASSVIKLPNGVVRVWLKHIVKNEYWARTIGDTYIYFVEFNCRERLIRNGLGKIYYKRSEVKDLEYTQWEIFLPDSIEERLYSLVCK